MELILDFFRHHELLRVLVGTGCGYVVLVCLANLWYVLGYPAEYESRREILLAIKAFNREEITTEQLESKCPEGSIRYSVAYTIARPHRIKIFAQRNGTC